MSGDAMAWAAQIRDSGPSLMITVLSAVYVSRWIDAKLGADMQARVGPNRSGPLGVLQPLADFMRLFTKTHSAGSRSRASLYWWGPCIPLLSLLSAVPAGSAGPLLRAPLAVFAPIVLGLCFAWAVLLVNWREAGIEGRLSSLRQGALSVAATFPALIAITVAGMTVRGFSWQSFDEYQSFLPIYWVAFSNPFSLVCSAVFLMSGMLMFSLPPFSPNNAKQLFSDTSVSGELGVRLAWIKLSQRIAPVCWSLVTVHLFFGGGRLPQPLVELLHEGSLILPALQVVLLVIKVLLIHAIYSVVGRTLPHIRSDQGHDFAWRVLSPAALLSLLFLCLFGMGIDGWAP